MEFLSSFVGKLEEMLKTLEVCLQHVIRGSSTPHVSLEPQWGTYVRSTTQTQPCYIDLESPIESQPQLVVMTTFPSA